MNLQQAMDLYLPQIEEELRRVLTLPPGSPREFYGMLHYHMGWVDESFNPTRTKGGKRIRPLATMLTCRALGKDPVNALPAAAAVELVHNFSLIHDDIEDNSHTRRGRRTVWSIWGQEQGINAGDTMFITAGIALYHLIERGFPPERISSVGIVLANACIALCRGQHLDISFETRMDVTVEDYLGMIHGKTAAILGCSCQLGAMVVTEDPAVADVYRRFGEELGLAFQIQDDVLGVWGKTEVVGKVTGDDIRQRKKTLPVIYTLNSADRRHSGRLHEIYSKPKPEITDRDVEEATAIMEECGALDYTHDMANRHLENALHTLEEADPDPGVAEALPEFAHFIVERNY